MTLILCTRKEEYSFFIIIIVFKISSGQKAKSHASIFYTWSQWRVIQDWMFFRMDMTDIGFDGDALFTKLNYLGPSLWLLYS